MALRPPITFDAEEYYNSIYGQTTIIPSAPITWNSATHVVGVLDANLTQRGVVNTVAQSFAGIKTFAVVPQCDVVPLLPQELANKGYVDDRVSNNISWHAQVDAFYDFTVPPVGTPDATRYIAIATIGDFTANYIYQYNAGAASWIETIPLEGWTLYCREGVLFADETITYNGTDWVNNGSSIRHQNLIGAGVKTHADIDSIWTNTAESVSIGTGALALLGGIGIAKSATIGVGARILGAVDSTSVATGALVVAGGAGVGGALSVKKNFNLFATATSAGKIYSSIDGRMQHFVPARYLSLGNLLENSDITLVIPLLDSPDVLYSAGIATETTPANTTGYYEYANNKLSFPISGINRQVFTLQPGCDNGQILAIKFKYTPHYNIAPVDVMAIFSLMGNDELNRVTLVHTPTRKFNLTINDNTGNPIIDVIEIGSYTAVIGEESIFELNIDLVNGKTQLFINAVSQFTSAETGMRTSATYLCIGSDLAGTYNCYGAFREVIMYNEIQHDIGCDPFWADYSVFSDVHIHDTYFGVNNTNYSQLSCKKQITPNVQLPQSDATFYLSGVSFNAEYSLAPPFPIYNNSCQVVDNKILVSNRIDWQSNSQVDAGNTGCVRVKIFPKYSGNPGGTVMFIDLTTLATNNNRVQLFHNSLSKLVFRIYNSVGTNIFSNEDFTFVPVANFGYELEINWDLVGGQYRAYINGARVINVINVFGVRYSSDKISMQAYLAPTQTFYVQDLQIFRSVQHISIDYVVQPIALLKSNQLQFDSTLSKKQIVLSNTGINNYQFTGFGTLAGEFRAQLPATTNHFSIFSAIDDATEQELFRVEGNLGATAGVSIFNTTDSSSIGTGSLVVAGGIGVAKNITVGVNATILGTTDSSSAGTGSLIVAGGIGVAKSITVGANISILGATDSISIGTGSLIVAGGVGIAKSITVGTNVSILGTENSVSIGTGSLVVSGGVGIVKNATIGANISILGETDSSTVGTGSLVVAGGVGIAKSVTVGTNMRVLGTDVNSSLTTGALVVAGGAGIGGALSVNGTITVQSTDAALYKIRVRSSGAVYYLTPQNSVSLNNVIENANVVLSIPFNDGNEIPYAATNSPITFGRTGTYEYVNNKVSFPIIGANRYTYIFSDTIDNGTILAIKFKYTPHYANAPASIMGITSLANQDNVNNKLTFVHDVSGNLVLNVNDTVGVPIINEVAIVNWLPIAEKEYIFEIDMDLVAGSTNLFIDGVKQGTTIVSTGVRAATTRLNIGCDITNSNNSYAAYREFMVYNAIQHTVNYVSWYSSYSDIRTSDNYFSRYNAYCTSLSSRQCTSGRIQLPQSGATFYLSGKSSTAEYSLAPPTYNVSIDCNVQGNKLLIKNYIAWLCNSSIDGANTGCVRIKITPNYNTDPYRSVSFINLDCGSGNTNLLRLYHSYLNDKELYFQVYDNAGNPIVDDHSYHGFHPVAGTEYEFEMNWNTTEGIYSLYIDGTRVLSLSGSTGVRGAANRILMSSNDPAESFYAREMQIFTTPQHNTASYVVQPVGASFVGNQLQFDSTLSKKQIVLSNTAINDYQFTGFGTLTNEFRAQLPAITNHFSFYSATSAVAEQEVMRIEGDLGASAGVSVFGTTNSSTVGTGALVVAGGVGIARSATIGENLSVLGSVIIKNSIDATKTLNAIVDTLGDLTLTSSGQGLYNLAGTGYNARVGKLLQTDAVALLSFYNSIDADYMRGNSITASASAGAYTIANEKLKPPNYASVSYRRWTIDNNIDGGMVFTIVIKYTPQYSSIGTVYNVGIWSMGTASSLNSYASLQHQHTTANLAFNVNNSAGTSIGNVTLNNWVPTIGTEYTIEVDCDLTNSLTNMFINGVLVGASLTATGTRIAGTRFQIGSNLFNNSAYTRGDFRDCMIFNTIQHTAGGYDPTYSIAHDFNTDGLNAFKQLQVKEGINVDKNAFVKGTVYANTIMAYGNGSIYSGKSGGSSQIATDGSLLIKPSLFDTTNVVIAARLYTDSDACYVLPTSNVPIKPNVVVGTPTFANNMINLTGAANAMWLGWKSSGLVASQGCLRFRYIPNYSGAPGTTCMIFRILPDVSSNFNRISIYHSAANNKLYLVTYNNVGSAVTTTSMDAAMVAGTSYEFEINWNLTVSPAKVYGFYNGATFSADGLDWSNYITPDTIVIGAGITSPSNARYADLIVFNTMQHIIDYIPAGYNLLGKVVVENTCTLAAGTLSCRLASDNTKLFNFSMQDATSALMTFPANCYLGTPVLACIDCMGFLKLPAANAPTMVNFASPTSGIQVQLLGFPAGSTTSAHFSFSLPRAWKQSSAIIPTIVYAGDKNEATNTAVFKIIWGIRDVGSVAPAPVYDDNITSDAGFTQWSAVEKVFATQTPVLNVYSPYVYGTLSRMTGDSYTGNVCLIDFRFKILQDTLMGKN